MRILKGGLKMDQKKYENPEIDVVKYNSEEVLTDSQGNNNPPVNPNKPIDLPPDLDPDDD